MRVPVLATAIMLAGTALASSAMATSAQVGTAAAPAANEGPIVQMFQWSWDSVGQECQNFLGPKGFGAVQVSPPQEHPQLTKEGHPWYQDYQPVSYKLQTRRGDREQFANMVASCNKAGVKVYVDAVLNHMTGSGSVNSGPGSAGSTFEKYDYPGVYGDADFSGCRRDIENYNDPWEVRHCELVGLADLKTESEKVRRTEVAYLNDLVGMGVSGFRLDGAKHMPPEDIAAIVGALQNVPGTEAKPYVYQEVIGDSTTSPAEYVGNGDVTEFTYTNTIANAFKNGSLAGLASLPDSMSVESDQAVVFVDNHDTQRSAPTLTYKDGAVHDLANAFEMAYPYGTPKVMTSYSFDDSDAGPPADQNGVTSPAECDSGAWVCEHRHQAIAGMSGFHNTAYGTELNNWWDNGNGQVSFGRGAAGFVAFNREGGELSREFQSSLPAGTYCNVLTGEVIDGKCTGATVDVGADGKLNTTVAPDSGVALHVDAKVA